MFTIKQSILRIFFVLEIAVFICVYLLGAHGVQLILQLKKENRQLSQEIMALNTTINTLEQELFAWNATPFYKEKFAREQLQMAREGEIIFFLEPQTTTYNIKDDMEYKLAPLPYAYDALEPYIDAKTMEIHHDKHHQAYIDNLNKALAQAPELQDKPLEELLKNINALPESVKTAVRNNGGGTLNHAEFWLMMKKNGGGEPQGQWHKKLRKNSALLQPCKNNLTLRQKVYLAAAGRGYVSELMAYSLSLQHQIKTPQFLKENTLF